MSTTHATSSVVALSNATKVFGPRTLFAGLSFTVEPATLTVLFGDRGAGKTTLLRCIAGVEPLTSGTLDVSAPVAGLVTTIRSTPGPVELHDTTEGGPAVVVVDEPTLLLRGSTGEQYPAEEGRQVRAHLHALADAGHAVVAATHDRYLAASADQVVEL